MGASILKLIFPIIVDFFRELLLPNKEGQYKHPLSIRVSVLLITILGLLLAFTTIKVFEQHSRAVNAEANLNIIKADRERDKLNNYLTKPTVVPSPPITPTKTTMGINKHHKIDSQERRHKLIHEINN